MTKGLGMVFCFLWCVSPLLMKNTCLFIQNVKLYRGTESLRLLVHFPVAIVAKAGLIQSKELCSGAGSLLHVSHLGSGTQAFEPLFADFPAAPAGSWIGSGTARTQMVSISRSCRQQLYPPLHSAGPVLLLFVFLFCFVFRHVFLRS